MIREIGNETHWKRNLIELFSLICPLSYFPWEVTSILAYSANQNLSTKKHQQGFFFCRVFTFFFFISNRKETNPSFELEMQNNKRVTHNCQRFKILENGIDCFGSMRDGRNHIPTSIFLKIHPKTKTSSYV